jgi:uncharacterized protein YkwD
MRKTIVVAFVAFAVPLTAFVPMAGACPAAKRPAVSQTSLTAQRALRCLINHARKHRRLPRLRGDYYLAVAAQGHSDAMASQNFFGHDGMDGTPVSRVRAAGYLASARGTWSVGENLGFGTGRLGSPMAIFRSWMRSPEHRSIILMRGWRQLGVGLSHGSPIGSDGPDMGTYTVDFGHR